MTKYHWYIWLLYFVHHIAGLLAEPSTSWVIHSADATTNLQNHWIVSNLKFFSDTGCTNEVTTPSNIRKSLYDCCRNCGSAMEEKLGYNGGNGVSVVDVLLDNVCHADVCNSNPDMNFAACQTSEHRKHYLGFVFNEPVEVKCIQVCQAGCAEDSVDAVALVAWREDFIAPGFGAWKQVATISLDSNDQQYAVTDNRESYEKHLDLQDVYPPPPPSPKISDDGLSITEIIIIVVVTVFAGSLIMFLYLWYFKKRGEHTHVEGAQP